MPAVGLRRENVSRGVAGGGGARDRPTGRFPLMMTKGKGLADPPSARRHSPQALARAERQTPRTKTTTQVLPKRIYQKRVARISMTERNIEAQERPLRHTPQPEASRSPHPPRTAQKTQQRAERRRGRFGRTRRRRPRAACRAAAAALRSVLIVLIDFCSPVRLRLLFRCLSWSLAGLCSLAHRGPRRTHPAGTPARCLSRSRGGSILSYRRTSAA